MKLNICDMYFTVFRKSWTCKVLIDNSYHQFDIEKDELNIMYIYET